MNFDRRKMTIDNTLPKLKQWASERGLLDVSPDVQLLKLQEELGELTAAHVRNDSFKVKDSIGDMFVVMSVLCFQTGIDITECITGAYSEIADRTGTIKNGAFIKDEDLK